MRTLKFNVDVQRIQKDPDCDFTNIVAGTQNYLQAYFTFSPEWHDCVLVASFWRGEKEHAVLIEDGKCEIPPEVLVGRTFGLSVIGQREDYCITTNRIKVRQEVSR
jgi:hypothetical protein